MIIAIDGPAGAGKSTIAKILAQKLGFLYIDTGAMYRALTLKVIEKGLPVDDLNGIIHLAKQTKIELLHDSCTAELKVLLDGNDVSKSIRETRVTKFVSDVAKIKEVREIMLGLQRKLGLSTNSILDGRDIGTVVFPDAQKKIFLDANFQERTLRRYKELKDSGYPVSLQEIENDLSNRDKIDSTRETAPLKKADDAILVDTTSLSIDQVVDKILNILNSPNE
ncbi:MAG: (d)CMP kinase [Candidatus Omnitrophica bacterium]|jgi:cytidylate kinase|nr:(d)CMP kinase [Candidatus Omnitrophota bacterium]